MRYLRPPTLTSLLNHWRHLKCSERDRMLRLPDPMTCTLTRQRISSILGFDSRTLIPEIMRERRALERDRGLGTLGRARRPRDPQVDRIRAEAIARPMKWRSA